MRSIVAVMALVAGIRSIELGSCSEAPRAPQTHVVGIRAVTGDGEPLPGVRVAMAGREVGSTAASGDVRLTVLGIAGQRVQLQATCPPGFDGPREPATFLLVRSTPLPPSAAPRTALSLTCDARQRTLAIAIQTGQPSLPIRMRGEELARTNQAGTAHVLLTVDSGSDVELTLDTAQRSDLRPSSPSRVFAVGSRDDFVVWNQPFASSKPKSRPKKIAIPPPRSSGTATPAYRAVS
jgi:hypothetical protein